MSHATTESDHQTADVLMSLMSGKTKSNVAEPSSSPPPFPCNGGSSQNDDISADPKTASGDSSGEAHKGSVEDDEPVAENPKEPLPEQADSLERPRLDKYFFKLPHHRPLSKELAFEILTNGEFESNLKDLHPVGKGRRRRRRRKSCRVRRLGP